MVFVTDQTELVTAVTDAMMAMAGAMGLLVILRQRGLNRFKRHIWVLVYSLFISAAIAGTIYHGLALPAPVLLVVWQILFFVLGLMVAMFVVGLVFDLSGERLARRFMLPMVGLACLFFGVSFAAGQDYSLFVAYEALALLSALIGYTYLAIKQRVGAWQMAVGVFLTVVAAVVQAAQLISFTLATDTLVLHFDHNANYHLIQISGVLFLTLGVTAKQKGGM